MKIEALLWHETQMRSASSVQVVVGLLLLAMIIHTIGWDELPKRVQSLLEKAGHKITRWRRENPIVSLKSDLTPRDKQRKDAILDWLNRTEDGLRSGGQGAW